MSVRWVHSASQGAPHAADPDSCAVLGQSLAFALLVGALAVTPMAPVDAQKNKPIPNPTANLTFADSGHAVTSDGSGPYSHGVDGVEATVFMSPSYSGSGDLVVQLGSSRHVNVNLQSPMGLTGGTVTGAPTGIFAGRGCSCRPSPPFR